MNSCSILLRIYWEPVLKEVELEKIDILLRLAVYSITDVKSLEKSLFPLVHQLTIYCIIQMPLLFGVSTNSFKKS